MPQSHIYPSQQIYMDCRHGQAERSFSRTNAVTMVYFESMGLLEPGEIADLDALEMLRIFGGAVVREPIDKFN